MVNGETILFAGGHYELKGSEVSKYYFAGASRIAVRKYVVPQTTTLNYLAGDHLGSTSLVTNASGALVAETRYKPWGEVRYTTPSQTLPTRYTFTGQYSHVNDDATDLGAAGFGLMFYNARWYDPALGRMAQADTVVPGGVQGLDRYAYAGNSPLMYTDPTGHYRYRNDYESRIHAQKMYESYLESAGSCTENDSYESCTEKIETKFPNVNIISCIGDEVNDLCVPMTVTQLLLIQDVLLAYPYTLGQFQIGRTDATTYSFTDTLSSPIPTVWIGEEAFDVGPSGGTNFEFFRNWLGFGIEDNYRGNVAHEFTHVAMYYDPQLVVDWKKIYSDLEIETGDYRLGKRYPFRYGDTGGCNAYANIEECVLVETFAMAVASKLYGSWWWNFWVGNTFDLPAQ